MFVESHWGPGKEECNEESEDFNFSCDAVNKLQLFLSDLVDTCYTGGGI